MPPRTLKFPTDHDIGYLYKVDAFGEVYRHEYGINVGAAKGEKSVFMDEGWMLQLTVDKGDFEALSSLDAGDLESLLCTIYNTAITDEQCKNISHLTALKELVLDSKSLSNVGLAHLTGLENLESLSLMSSRIDDDGLLLIAENFKKLRHLNLRETKVTQDGLKLVAHIPKVDQ